MEGEKIKGELIQEVTRRGALGREVQPAYRILNLQPPDTIALKHDNIMIMLLVFLCPALLPVTGQYFPGVIQALLKGKIRD